METLHVGPPRPRRAGQGTRHRSDRPETRSPDDPLEWFAVVAPGGERAALREIMELPGGSGARAAPGGVEVRGDLELGARANLWLRLPTRILLRLGSFPARELSTLRKRAARLDWARFLAPDERLVLRISQSRSRLYHTGAVGEQLAGALREALGDRVTLSSRALPDAQLVLARGQRDRWTLSLDSSGESLHRRGWRVETARASLRETLASLVLSLCRWRPDEPLIDPFAGAGTFAIEAASRALGIAAGAGRSFVSERWRVAPESLWASLREEAEAGRGIRATAPIVAADRDLAVLESARRNAIRAGCAEVIELVHAPIDAVVPPASKGLVVVNPPYGRRLGRRDQLPAHYAALGRSLREGFAGWRAGVLIHDASLESSLRLRIVERHALVNGGLPVRLLIARL